MAQKQCGVLLLNYNQKKAATSQPHSWRFCDVPFDAEPDVLLLIYGERLRLPAYNLPLPVCKHSEKKVAAWGVVKAQLPG